MTSSVVRALGPTRAWLSLTAPPALRPRVPGRRAMADLSGTKRPGSPLALRDERGLSEKSRSGARAVELRVVGVARDRVTAVVLRGAAPGRAAVARHSAEHGGDVGRRQLLDALELEPKLALALGVGLV